MAPASATKPKTGTTEESDYWVKQKEAKMKAIAKRLIIETKYFVVRKSVVVVMKALFKGAPFWCFKPFIIMRVVNTSYNSTYMQKARSLQWFLLQPDFYTSIIIIRKLLWCI